MAWITDREKSNPTSFPALLTVFLVAMPVILGIGAILVLVLLCDGACT